MKSVPTRGDIGVRCARDQGALWFHLKKPIGTEDVNRGGEGITRQSAEAAPFWEKLTDLGGMVVMSFLNMQAVRNVDLRPDYICVTLHKCYSWEAVLPQVIDVIRTALRQPRAVVYLKQPYDSRVENWHEPLLRQFV